MNDEQLEIAIAARLQPLRELISPIRVGTLPGQAQSFTEIENSGDVTVLIPSSDAARPEVPGGCQTITSDIQVVVSLPHRFAPENSNQGIAINRATLSIVKEKCITLLKGYIPPDLCAQPIWYKGSRLYPPNNNLWTEELYFQCQHLLP